MGPRPIGRGNYGRSAPRGGGREASMGPRPIGRGNSPPMTAYLRYRRSRLQWGRDRSVAEIQRRPRRTRRDGECFNGAATDRSRKLPSALPSTGRATRSFNGAATDRSRKSVVEVRGFAKEWLASMGPRPIGRGNEAQFPASPAARWYASMGPRPSGRGNASAQPWSTQGRAVASMGPRPIGRGNAGARSEVCIREESFNGAATDRSRKSPKDGCAAGRDRSSNG